MPRVGAGEQVIPGRLKSPIDNISLGKIRGTEQRQKYKTSNRHNARIFAPQLRGVREPIDGSTKELAVPAGPEINSELSMLDASMSPTPRIEIQEPSGLQEPGPDPDPGKAEHSAGLAFKETFGINPKDLGARMAARKEVFAEDVALTEKLEAKTSKKRYEWKSTEYTEIVNGRKVTRQEEVLVKTKNSLNDRVLETSERSAKKVQAQFNRLNKNVRHLTRMPRKTGSNYVDSKPTQELLTPSNLMPVDCAWSAQGVVKGGAVIGAGLSPGDVGRGLSAVADAGSFVAVPLAVSDGMVAVKGAVVAASQRSQDKQNVFQYRSGANRFAEKIESGKISEMTASESDHFLDFKSSAKKLFHPTREQASTKKIGKNQLGRLAVVQPISVGFSTGAAIASHVVGAIPPLAVAGAAVGAVSAGIEVVEGIHEGLRSADLHARAELRKEAMTEILESAKGNTDAEAHELLKGVVASLSEHQDRVKRRAKREEKYAAFHATKAGASIGPLGVLGATGVAFGLGAVGAATLGAAVPLAVLPAVAWGVAVSVRSHERLQHARRYKWDQRAMRVASFELTREELEQKLLDGTPIEVEFREGEYQSQNKNDDTEYFPGRRQMKFTRDTNPYMGFDWLAFKVLDMVREGGYDANAAWVKLLQVHDIDAVDLFAICKAASFKPEDKRLAYIQRRIAEKMELPLLMSPDLSEQVLPHPSFFIKKFENAKKRIPEFKALKNSAEIERNVQKAIRAEIRAGLWKEVPVSLQSQFTDDAPEDRRTLLYKMISQDDRRAIKKKIEERVSGAMARETAEEIRKELKKSFPGDGEAGMKAFDAVIGVFLEKTKKLDETPLIKQLKLVVRTPESLDWLNDELQKTDALELRKPVASDDDVEEAIPFEEAFERTQRLAQLNKPLKTLQEDIQIDDLLA